MPLHDGSPDIDYEVDAEIMELPYIFRTIVQNIPYFHIASNHFHDKRKFKVGIVWKSGDWDMQRSIPFSLISSITESRNIELYILQRGNGLAERIDNIGILSGSDDIYETAVVIKSLDLIISVDTMVAHLAGALAVPVWLLLNANPDWRWMINRSDSPWYPTMRIFRQARFGEWESVIQRVRQQFIKHYSILN